MKVMIALFLALAAIAFCAGCATSSTVNKSDSTLIQSVFDKLLPSDFNGPVDLSHANQYFQITVQAGGVHRLSDGKWTWDWLTYERQSHFPIFSGMTWSSTGKVKLGSPK